MLVGALNVDSYILTTLTRPHSWFRATIMDCGRFQPRPVVLWCDTNCLSSTLDEKQSVEGTKKTYVCVFVHEQREGIRLRAADLTVASLLPRTPERGNLSCLHWMSAPPDIHTHTCTHRLVYPGLQRTYSYTAELHLNYYSICLLVTLTLK